MWEAIKAALSSVVRYTFVRGTTESGHGDAVDGELPDDGSAARELGVRRMFPWGFDSRPPAGVEAVIVFNRGGASNGMMVGNGRSGHGPTLAEGEIAIFSKAPGAYIKIDNDGAITVVSANNQAINVTASGTGDVVVNGGALKVARDTDPISVGTWTHVPAAGAGVTPCSLTYTPPAGAPTPIVAPGVAVTGKITNGATRFKG